MAQEAQYQHQGKVDEQNGAVSTDRGIFDFLGKKEEEKKCDGEAIASEFDDKVKFSEEKKEQKEEDKKPHESLLQKLQRSGSSSSSSSDEEEVEEDGVKKKKKKEKKTEKKEEKCDEKAGEEAEEKKGFLDKIKEKLPGGKKPEEVETPPPTPASAADCATTPDAEKKGFLEKIKEKIPGYNSKSEEEKEKEKEKEGVSH